MKDKNAKKGGDKGKTILVKVYMVYQNSTFESGVSFRESNLPPGISIC